MKKELGLDYDFKPHNFVDITEDYPTKGFNRRNTSFADVPKTVLNNGIEPGNDGCKQIFKMNDGKFILEVEYDGMVDYFYSENIEDLF